MLWQSLDRIKYEHNVCKCMDIEYTFPQLTLTFRTQTGINTFKLPLLTINSG